MIEIKNTNKDILAKLMATENITVIHKKVPTAYFDIKSRIRRCIHQQQTTFCVKRRSFKNEVFEC